MVYIIIDYMPPEKDTTNRLYDKEVPKSTNTNVVSKAYEQANNTFDVNEKSEEPLTNAEATKFIQSLTLDNRRTVKRLKQSDQNQSCLSYEIKFNWESKFIVNVDPSNDIEQQKQDFIVMFKLNNYQSAIQNEDALLEKTKKNTTETSEKIPDTVQNIIDKSDPSTLSIKLNKDNFEIGKIWLDVNDNNIASILDAIYKKCPNIEELDLEWNHKLATLPDNINKFNSLKKLSLTSTKVDFIELNKIENKSKMIFNMPQKPWEFAYKGISIGDKKIWLYVWIASYGHWLEYFMFTDEWEELTSLNFWRFKLDDKTKISTRTADNQEKNIMFYKVISWWNSNYWTYDIEKYETASQDHINFMKDIAFQSWFKAESDLWIENSKDRSENDIKKIRSKFKKSIVYQDRENDWWKNINKQARDSFITMVKDMRKKNMEIAYSSIYRDIDRQTATFFYKGTIKHYYPDDLDLSKQLSDEEKKVIETEYLERCKIAAPPGYSEHHTGKAFDIIWSKWQLKDDHKEFLRLQKNASKYWFKLSYSDPNHSRYEPWHRLYVWK